MPTVEDTRIDEIGKIILDHRYEKDPRDMNALKYSSYLIAKKILEYMAPELAKAQKWDKLKSLFETSCDKCFLNHICGTHGNPGAVCEDIKEALEGGQNDKP